MRQLNPLVQAKEKMWFYFQFNIHFQFQFFYSDIDYALQLNTSTSLEEVKELDRQGLLPRNLVDPVAKDTVTVPDGGYVILRMFANNPGELDYWMTDECLLQI